MYNRKAAHGNGIIFGSQLYWMNNKSKANAINGKFRYYGKVYKDGVRKLAQKVTLEQVNKLFKEVFQQPIVSCTIYGDASKNDILTSKDFYQLFK